MISTGLFRCKNDKSVVENRLLNLYTDTWYLVYNKDNISNWGKEELEKSDKMRMVNWPLDLVGADSIVSQSHKLTGRGQ